MAAMEYLKEKQDKKTPMKVFLTNGTMLEGTIVDFDTESVVIDKCLVWKEKIISMTPKSK